MPVTSTELVSPSAVACDRSGGPKLMILAWGAENAPLYRIIPPSRNPGPGRRGTRQEVSMHQMILSTTAVLLFVIVPVTALPLKTENVTFKSGDETVGGYLALPESTGRHPPIIVDQEWWW